MAKGSKRRPARPTERSKTKPQNLRAAPGAFDLAKSRVKALADWDDADLRDEQDDFLDGKDKVLLEHRHVDDDGELDLPDEVFPVLDRPDSDADDALLEDEEELPQPKRKERKAKRVDDAPKGRFAKAALQGPASSSSSGSESDPVVEGAAAVVSSDEDSDGDESSDPDAEAWGSYHVSHPTTKRRGKRVEPVDAAEEAENKKLELAEAMRLQKRARDRLKEADFLPLAGPVKGDEGDGAEEETVVVMGKGRGVDVDALAKEPARFETEGEAIAVLLKDRPECLALVDDFRRQLPVLREMEKELKGVKAISTAGDDDDLNESLESFRWLHYHTLSTYLSCVAFYFRVLLTAPPASSSRPDSLLSRVTNTLATLRKTLADLEDQGLTGDGDDLAGASGEEEGEDSATGEELEALQKVLRRRGYPAGLGDLEEDELKELLEGQLLSPPREEEPAVKSNGVGADEATKKPRRKKPSKKPVPSVVPDEDILDLRPRPPVGPSAPTDPTSSLDDDFLDPLTLSAPSAEEKDRRTRAIRFHTDKISAKRKRREAATGVGQGDEEVEYKTREQRRREALRKQRHGLAPDVDDDDEEGDAVGEAKGKRKRPGESYYDVVKELKESAKRAKKAQHDERRLAERDILSTEADSAGPRSATRQILANKGLTPKRNKLDRNPRVKKRKRYETAQRKVSSQRSVFKPQEAQRGRSGGYEGEKSGIRTGVVKSRKL